MKFLVAILSVFLSAQVCQAKVLALTKSNFDESTAGKTVFIKFFAPWCGHCKSMAEDWEKLASEWEGHAVGLIAEVDCTDEDGGGQALCEDYGVQGFPTLMYGSPSSPESYEGGRDYESLAEFAKENIGKPVCSIENLDLCEAEQKAAIEALMKKSTEDLEAVVADVDEKISANQQKYEDGLEELNQTYEKMTKEFNEQNEEIKTGSNYGLVKQVLASKKKGSKANDEL